MTWSTFNVARFLRISYDQETEMNWNLRELRIQWLLFPWWWSSTDIEPGKRKRLRIRTIDGKSEKKWPILFRLLKEREKLDKKLCKNIFQCHTFNIIKPRLFIFYFIFNSNTTGKSLRNEIYLKVKLEVNIILLKRIFKERNFGEKLCM